MNVNDLYQLLESVHPMSDALKEHLDSVLKEKNYPKKAHILRAGHVCKNIYFIAEGLLRCYYVKEDREVSSWFMKEGDVVVSVESFLFQRPSYESIQALETSIVYYVSYNELQHIYRNFPEFNFIGRVLTERYYALSEERLYSLRMQRSIDRYSYLMKNHSELFLRVPAKHLASYLGISEVTMSKIKVRY